jgi:hypothetical protein
MIYIKKKQFISTMFEMDFGETFKNNAVVVINLLCALERNFLDTLERERERERNVNFL